MTKITPKNQDKICNLLRSVNGLATTHTYSTYAEVEYVAQNAEKKAHDLLRNKSLLPGCQVVSDSGERVTNSYKNTRAGTRLHLVRRSSGWYLQHCERITLHKEGGGQDRLKLTAEQSAIATERFQRQYSVIY